MKEKNTPDLEAPETGNSEKNVETDIMDLSSTADVTGKP